MAHIKLDSFTLGIFRRCTITEDAIKLPEQLPPDDYRKIKKAIEAAGGKWHRASGLHKFPDGTGFITSALEADAGGETAIIRDRVKDFQFFPTPQHLARDLVAHAVTCNSRLVAGEFTALEPSCGDGSILRELAGAGPGYITAVELRPEGIAAARKAFAKNPVAINFEEGDFLSFTPETLGTYDIIVMNPPFTKDQDLAHVTHAYRFLKPGGRLVALTGPAWPESCTRRRNAFRSFLEEHEGEWELLPEAEFGRTSIKTIRITLDRPKAAAPVLASVPKIPTTQTNAAIAAALAALRNV